MELKLLIAEDEKVERQALRVLIMRNFPELTILDDAVNGIDLLRKVEKDEPHIVISDIEMPGLDGLEALETLKRKGYGGKLIIQTAYSQFEYARKALSLGAEAYLLKPIKKENLIARLEDVISELRKEKKEVDEKDRYEEIFRQMKPLLDRELVNTLQMGQMRQEFAGSYLEQMLPSRSYTVVSVEGGFSEEGNITSDLLLEREEFHRNFIAFVEGERPALIGTPVNNRLTLLIGHGEAESYKTKLDSIDFSEKKLEEFPRVTIGIGRSVEGIHDLPRAYRESLAALRSRDRIKRLCHFGDMSGEESLLPDLGIEPEDLQDLIHGGDKSEFVKLPERILPAGRCVGLNDFKDILVNDLIELIRAIPFSAGLSGGTAALKSLLDELVLIRSKEGAAQWFADKLWQMSEKIREEARKLIHESVRKAQEYIRENYMRDISLDIVAEEIGVSPYHLSHLFSQELNITYKKYLTGIRMEKAEELLGAGRYSLRELAGLCGYNNPSYFARVYLKETGDSLEEISHVCQVRVNAP